MFHSGELDNGEAERSPDSQERFCTLEQDLHGLARQSTASIEEDDGGNSLQTSSFDWIDCPLALLAQDQSGTLPLTWWDIWCSSNAELEAPYTVQADTFCLSQDYSDTSLSYGNTGPFFNEQPSDYGVGVSEGRDVASEMSLAELQASFLSIADASADFSLTYDTVEVPASHTAISDPFRNFFAQPYHNTSPNESRPSHADDASSNTLSRTLSYADSTDLSKLSQTESQCRSQFNIPGTGSFKLESGPNSCNTGSKRKRGSETSERASAARKQAKNDNVRHRSGVVCVRCKLMREKCSGKFPCDNCIKQEKNSFWKDICVPAKFTRGRCFSKNLYLKRAEILLINVHHWYPTSVRHEVHIKVSIGFSASLSVAVSAFHPKDPSLLQHVNFRSIRSQFLKTTPTQPFGLRSTEVTHENLDYFFDAMLDELIEDQARAYHHNFWRTTFCAALSLSKDKNRKDAQMLSKLLRIWAAHTVFFGRIWRVSEGGEAIGALWHEEIGAFDVPRTLYWQLDCITEKYMHDLELSVLQDLENFIFKRENATWFSVYLGAFIYLATLEKDSWNLESWEAKSCRWEKDHRVSSNPTMVWPLITPPRRLIQKNEHQAEMIASHVRACSKGSFPFSRGTYQELSPAGGGAVKEVKDYAVALSEDFHALSQQLMFQGTTPYREEDPNSLDYKYTRLIIEGQG